MELTFTSSDARRVCIKDASTFGLDKTNCKGFADLNCEQVRLACHTWLAICQDCGVREITLDTIKSNLVYAGLVPVVTAAGEVADLVLEGVHRGMDFSEVWLGHFEDRTYRLPWIVASEDIRYAHPAYEDCTKHILQALLYLERFTYDVGNLRLSFSIQRFKATNAGCRDYTFDWSRWPGQSVLDALRQGYREILRPDLWHYDIADAHFSSGSCAGGNKSLVSKLRALASFVPSAYHHPLTALPGGKNMGVKGKEKVQLYPNLIEVPKKLLSRRVIAPERVDIAFYGQAALEALRRVVDITCKDYINEHDQSINNTLACEGSLTGEWATIDMSAASDSITRSLFFAVLPAELHSLYQNFMSAYCVLPEGSLYRLWLTFTSGHPLTWLTEATWFLNIGRVGTSLAGVPDADKKVFAYGDDLIVPSEAYDTVCELLELLGHTVNRRKSYGSGIFRESCGGWYCGGHNVTPLFWPRRIVHSGKPEAIQAIAGLQHKACELGTFPYLDMCCRGILRQLDSRMSVSSPETVADDIWDPMIGEFDSSRAKHIHVDRIWVGDKPRRCEPLLEHYIYYQYLISGPRYDSELDRLLGTSTSRIQLLDAYAVETELRVSYR